MSNEVRVQDFRGNPIGVGTRCWYGAPPKWGEVDEFGNRRIDYLVEVIDITEPDADVDDATRRGVYIPPMITVKFPDATTDILTTMYVEADFEYTLFEESGDLEVCLP